MPFALETSGVEARPQAVLALELLGFRWRTGRSVHVMPLRRDVRAGAHVRNRRPAMLWRPPVRSRLIDRRTPGAARRREREGEPVAIITALVILILLVILLRLIA
jgi:hypothetical protein